MHIPPVQVPEAPRAAQYSLHARRSQVSGGADAPGAASACAAPKPSAASSAAGASTRRKARFVRFIVVSSLRRVGKARPAYRSGADSFVDKGSREMYVRGNPGRKSVATAGRPLLAAACARTAARPSSPVSRDADRDQESIVSDDGMTTTPSGLRYRDEEVGTGREAKRGDRVAVHYTGTLESGRKFDSSRDRGRPFEFEDRKSVV
jgi:hypothetical protein